MSAPQSGNVSSLRLQQLGFVTVPCSCSRRQASGVRASAWQGCLLSGPSPRALDPMWVGVEALARGKCWTSRWPLCLVMTGIWWEWGRLWVSPRSVLLKESRVQSSIGCALVVSDVLFGLREGPAICCARVFCNDHCSCRGSAAVHSAILTSWSRIGIPDCVLS